MVSGVRRYLVKALLLLLERRDFEDISIKELLLKAGVSKASFYRNYKTKEDILDDYFQGLFSIAPLAKDKTLNGFRGSYLLFLQQLWGEKKNLTILSRRDLLSKMLPYLFAYHRSFLGNEGELLKDPANLSAIVGALSSLTYDWMKNGFLHSPSSFCELSAKTLTRFLE